MTDQTSRSAPESRVKQLAEQVRGGLWPRRSSYGAAMRHTALDALEAIALSQERRSSRDLQDSPVASPVPEEKP